MKCLHCGNNQTNHLNSYLTKSAEVYFRSFAGVLFAIEKPIFRGLADIISGPFIFLLKISGIIRLNKDKSKALSKRALVMWDEAEKRGIEMEQIVVLGRPIEQYRAKVNGAWEYFESLPIPRVYEVEAYRWMDDKVLLKEKFLREKIPVAFGGSVSNLKSALTIFEKAEKPVITKPRLGSRGRHTTTFIHTEKDLERAYEIAKQLGYFVVVEEHLVGSVYRATYVGGEIVGILRGDPPRIVGDGKSKIKKLIEIKNKNKIAPVKDVVITPTLIEFLARQNFSLESVLPAGKTLDLSEKIGISYGGFAAEEFPTTHPKLLAHLKRAGDSLGAPVVGFDFIISDATADPDTQKWGIIEANSLPFINLHHFPLEGEPINVAAKVWDLWNR